MKIVHRIVSFNNSSLKDSLDLLEVKHTYSEDKFSKSVVLEIAESDPLWGRVESLIAEHGITSTPRVVFTKKEKDNAEWLSISSTGHFGYPQPEEGYEHETYDSSDYCERCGMGGIQKEPFRIKKEPHQKRASFFQLHWVFDEFFVRPQVKDELEKEKVQGLDFIQPVMHKSGESVETLFQMKVLGVAMKGMATEDLRTVTCKENNEESHCKLNPGGELRYSEDYPYCGRIKYHYPRRQPSAFCQSSFSSELDILKSFEYMGSGGRAHRMVLVSQKFRQLVLRHSWRGLSFEPILLF